MRKRIESENLSKLLSYSPGYFRVWSVSCRLMSWCAIVVVELGNEQNRPKPVILLNYWGFIYLEFRLSEEKNLKNHPK